MNCEICEKEAVWKIYDQEGGTIRYCCVGHLATVVAKLRVFVGGKLQKEKTHELTKTNAR